MTPPNETLINTRYSALLTRIRGAQRLPTAGAQPEVKLIAVSKTQPVESILPLLRLGHRIFGENRVQEAMAKWPPLKTQFPDCELHLIGPLQTNKVKEALALFDVIQTVDRPKLAEALATEEQRKGNHLSYFIQVNTGEEPQKAGVAPAEAEQFIRFCRNECALNVIGLMCIPPLDKNPAPHFALLSQIANQCGLSQLSMGMSGDYDIAIRLGATHARIGTALFGERA